MGRFERVLMVVFPFAFPACSPKVASSMRIGRQFSAAASLCLPDIRHKALMTIFIIEII